MRSMADVFREFEQKYPVIAFIRHTAIVVVAYVLVDRGVRIASHLARTDYDAPLLWIGALRWLGLHWVLAVPAIAFYAFSCWRTRGTWEKLDSFLLLKQIIVVPVLIVAWTYSLYAYNAYYDQSHWVDRALMVVFAAGAVWRPQLVLLCLYQARLIAWQFDYPLVGQFSMVETDVPFHLLALIPALLCARAIAPRISTSHALVVALCMIGAQYFASGVGKLAIGWLNMPQLYWSVYGGYATGWLAGLTPAQVGAISALLQPISPVLMLAVLCIECGAILLFWAPTATRAYLLLTILFHMSVLMMIGIAFWKWMACEVMIIYVVRRWLKTDVFRHNRATFVFTAALIALGPWWAGPANLSWYDTPLNYSYRIEALGESGHVYTLTPLDFAPYDAIFTFRNFSYLSEHPNLTGPYGVTFDRDTALALSTLATHASRAEALRDVEMLERDTGGVRYLPDMAAAFDVLVGRLLHNRRQIGAWQWLLDAVRPPSHLWTWSGASAYQGQEAIRTVRVYEDLYLARPSELSLLRTRLLREIKVAAT